MTQVMPSPLDLRPPTRLEWLAAGWLAVGLTVVFWSELWLGGGIMGGDLYAYYFPQKCYLVEHWRAGEFPLWNSLVGHGYPLVGEGQTAPFYPLHLLVYGGAAAGAWSVNSAYNIVQVTHYSLAFLFAWMYLRCIGCRQLGALLGALVFTYSWFPPRLCWEWAINGGAWFPLTFWCIERYLRTARWRYLAWLSIVLGNQMLAGHFNLAFITQVVMAAYIPLRLWWQPADLSAPVVASRHVYAIRLIMAILLGFALAAIQLAPSWELKQLSQRTGVHKEFDAGYGFIPLWYWKTWARLVSPWMWSHHEQHLREAPQLLASSTNKVEAHLYFGAEIVLLLVAAAAMGVIKWERKKLLVDDLPPPPLRGWFNGLCATFFRLRRVQKPLNHRDKPGGGNAPALAFYWIWSGIGLLALLLTSGLLLPVTRHVPGFAFFAGPGRFGLVTTWAVSVLAALGWQSLSDSWPKRTRGVVFGLLVATTIGDLMWVGREAGYVSLVSKPALSQAKSSAVQRVLRLNSPLLHEVRLFCRGPNLVTILDVASTPTYLGLSPAAYFDAATKLPGDPPFDAPPTPEQIAWLQRAGVTHILSFNPLDARQWPNTTLIWEGRDRFLNTAWGRPEPFYLYEFSGGRGRVAWLHPAANKSANMVEYRANRVTVETDSPAGDTLILTDLAYPGWYVTIDDLPVAGTIIDQMYRGVPVPPGRHRIEWTYRPNSVLWGGLVSGAALLFILTLAHLRFWHGHWFSGSSARHLENLANQDLVS